MLVLFCLSALICGISSCNGDDNEKETKTYPAVTALGERLCTGKIVALPNPPDGTSDPTPPGSVLGVETGTEAYILTVNGHWIWEATMTFEDVVYTLDDQVEITGTASKTEVSSSDKYAELKIKTIKKLK